MSLASKNLKTKASVIIRFKTFLQTTLRGRQCLGSKQKLSQSNVKQDKDIELCTFMNMPLRLDGIAEAGFSALSS